jgi:hypothetical protein
MYFALLYEGTMTLTIGSIRFSSEEYLFYYSIYFGPITIKKAKGVTVYATVAVFTVERKYPVRAVPVKSDKQAGHLPHITRFVEWFNAKLEYAKLGIFYYMSKKHLSRYLQKVCFR